MRLIDADKLSELLKLAIKLTDDRTEKAILNWAYTVIENRSTAYDIDKVIEQLEELRTYEKDGQCPKHDKCSKEPYECTSCYTTTAIEIVKGGAK